MAEIARTVLPIESHPAAASDVVPVLRMRGISHRFGALQAVDDVGFDIHPGEVVCLLGPSGCGKSTLLRITAGLERLQRGELAIDGVAMHTPHQRDVAPEQRNVGLMFQDAALFPHLTVGENVAFGIHRLPAAERRPRALALLRQLGMEESVDTYPHLLSGGQQQRVALARAMAPAPRLMLLDEPFSSLDARLRDQIRDDTLHLLKRSGAATLLVTHDPEEAMFMADRIALMRKGRLVQLGTPAELYCHPVDPFVVTFFGEVNRMIGVVQNGQVETPLGSVPAPRLPEGSLAQVLIRPEAIRVIVRSDEPDGHRRSHVIMSRLLGRTSLLHLCVHSSDGREQHCHSRMPGVFLPPENQPVDLRLDHSQTFVFPADEADAAG